MKSLCLLALGIVCLFNITVFGQNIHLYYGNANMTAYIGEDLWVPVAAYSQSLSICFMHVPLSTKNTYIDQRLGGIREYPLADWSDVSFLYTIPDTPLGYTSQSLIGWEDTSTIVSPYDPSSGLMFARFRMHVIYDQNLVGQTRSDVFAEGWFPADGFTQFGDCDNITEYNDFIFHFQNVTFLAPYLIGTGRGVMNNQQNHIDTRMNSTSDYRLEDVTRRQGTNPHDIMALCWSINQSSLINMIMVIPAHIF